MRYHLRRLTIPFIVLGGALFTFAQQRTPKFTDYPARIIRTRTSVKVRIHSALDTSCFRTMLRTTARHGDRFAGHYALDYWGCGTECARVGIVDLLTGRAYVSPFYIATVGGSVRAIKTEPDSRLVLVNDPKVVGKDWGDPPPKELQPSYFLWTGRHLLPINEHGRPGREPERAFERCSEM
jgi:hypothetical protein